MKVIIVGGSISGLTLALCLHRAGIEFEVLDAHPIAPPIGASIAIFQNGCMVLDQLEVYDDLRSLVDPMRLSKMRTGAGKTWVAGSPGLDLEERYFTTFFDQGFRFCAY